MYVVAAAVLVVVPEVLGLLGTCVHPSRSKLLFALTASVMDKSAINPILSLCFRCKQARVDSLTHCRLIFMSRLRASHIFRPGFPPDTP